LKCLIDGIIASAIVVAGISIEIIKRLRLRGPCGEPVGLAPKTLGSGVRYMVGGTMFGIGWALTGACPGREVDGGVCSAPHSTTFSRPAE